MREVDSDLFSNQTKGERGGCKNTSLDYVHYFLDHKDYPAVHPAVTKKKKKLWTCNLRRYANKVCIEM